MEGMDWQEQAGHDSVFEVDEYLRLAGLELTQIYGGWEAQPLSTESRRMIIIARK